MTRYHGLALAALFLFPALLPATGRAPDVAPVPVAAAAEAVPLVPLTLADLVTGYGPVAAADSDRDLVCLAQAVYFEARSEPLEGQMAVAQVVINRMNSPYWPDSVCEVVFQNEHLKHACQFSFACDGLSDRPRNKNAWARALKVSELALAGRWQDITDAATHYHADYVAPAWRTNLQETVSYGRHRFYRETENTRRGHLMGQQTG